MEIKGKEAGFWVKKGRGTSGGVHALIVKTAYISVRIQGVQNISV